MTKDVTVYSARSTALLRYMSSSQQVHARDTVQHYEVKGC